MNKLPVSQYWINFKKNDLLMVCIDRFVFLKIIGIRQFKKRMLPLFLLFIGHISIHSAEVQWRSGYEIYLPTVTVQRVFTGQSHDASIVYFDGKWFALWDSGTEQEGQVIWQSTSTDLVTWSPPIQAFSSPEGSVEPIIASTSTKLQWQPSLVVVGNELWCLWYATIKGLYFSKLLSSGDKWSSQLILARNGITIDNKKWSPFVTNNGIQTNSGTVVFPITLMREQENKTFFNLEKRDSIVYTNDGIDWVVSPGVSYGPTGSQCWEAAIWEPNPGQLNLISRNNREGSLANPLIPQENLKFSMTSLSNSDAWVPETFVPVEAAMSRPHVMHKGNRNFLAQNDSHISHHTQANRKNLSLFFNRGKGYDFVAGLTLFPETNFTTAPYPLIDYPQMAIWGDKGVVSFSQKPDNSLRSDTWSINVAVVDPLPADNTRYLFPRSARGKIEQDTTGGHHWVRFFNNYSSAGIDIDENDVSSDNVLLRFKFKPETFHRQIIASFGYPAVALASENGRLFIGKTEEPSTFIDCGPIETNEFTEIDFESGLGKTSVKVNGGPTLYTINYSPGEGRAMYFGLSFYGGASETPGAQFVVDLNSVKTAVVKGLPPTVPVMNSASSGSTIGFSWNGSVTGSGDVVSGYEVDIWTNITSSFVSGWQTRDVGMMDSTSLAGLRGGAIYYARARAYDGAGNRSAWSDVKEQRVMGLVNLNFEDTFGEGIPGWGTSDESNVIVTNAEGEFHGGAQALKIRGVPGAMAWQDWGAYTDEATYQLTFFGKVVSAEGVKGRIAVMTLPPGGGNSQIISSVDVPDSDWRRYSMTFSTTTISDGIRIQASANTSRLQGTMYFDDFTIIRVSTPVVKPAAPTGVTVVPDRNTLQVTWVEPASSVVDNYKVCVSTKEDFLTNVVGWNNRDVGNQTTVEVRGLAAYTTYFVKVLAQNRKSGMSSYSSAATAQTLETDPPSTPTIESTSLINMVEFRWGESINIYDSGLAGYEVDISADSEFTVYLPGWHTSDVGTKTSVTLEGLRGGTTYYARARAYDGAGNRSAWSDVKEQRVMGLVNPDFEELSTEGIIPGWNQTIGPNVTITTTDGEFHGGSAGLKITATPGVGPPGLWMAWQDWTGYVPGATYQLTFWGKVDSTEGLRGRVPVLTIPPNGAHGLVFALVDVTSPEWTKYSMTFSTPTESNGIRLRCYESTTTLNGTMYFDDFSITTVTLPVGLPGAPTAVTVSPGESSLVVNWQAPVGSVVDSYRVFVSTQINFGSHVPGWSNKDVGNMTTAQVNGLEESRTYYVRVRAYNRMRGTSAYSATITFDVAPPSVELSSPTAYASFTTPNTITISANASDDDVIQKVEFYLDGNLIGTDTTAPYETQRPVTESDMGPHIFSAKAFDPSGNVATASAPAYVMTPTYMLNVRDEGAKGDGLTDDTLAIQGAMLKGVPIYFPPGIYRITEELSFSPATRNAHFVGSNVLTRLMTSPENGSPILPGTETVIRYDGPLNDAIAVIRASYKPVGDDAGRDFSDSVLSLQIRNLTIDGNEKAGYGLSIARSMSPTTVSNVTILKAHLDGFNIDSTYYGLFEHIVSSGNGRDGIAIGQFGLVNNTTWRDIAAISNGGYGINAKFNRGNAMMRTRVSENIGTGFVQVNNTKPNTFDALDYFGDALFARYPETSWVNVKDYGAVGNGVDDDLPAINAAMGENKPIFFPAGRYRVNNEIVVPANLTNVAFIGVGTSQWPYNPQEGGPSISPFKTETMLYYVGPINQLKSVVRVSAETSNVEPTNQVSGFKMFDMGVDANKRAGYGLSIANVNDPLISGVSVRSALRDGIYINKLNNGRFELITSNNNMGNGVSIGKAKEEFAWNDASVNNTLFRVVGAPYNGRDGQFQESANLHGYGFGAWMGNNNTLIGTSAETNDGPNFVIGDWQNGNIFFNAYSELASQLESSSSGPVVSALNSRRTSRAYGLWITHAGGSWQGPTIESFFLHGSASYHPSEWIRLTGNPPSSAVSLKNVFSGKGIVKDWDNFSLTDSYSGLTDTKNHLEGIPPVVILSAPLNNTLYTAAQTVTISATANDNVAVTTVTFIIDGHIVSTDTEHPHKFLWPITIADNGIHTLTAIAFDAVGNSSTTAPVTVTVNIDETSPTAGLTNPGFEELSTEGIPGWNQTIGPNVTITTTDGEFHGGSAGLKITATPGVGPPGPWMAWQDWEGYTDGGTYQLTFWGKVESGEGLKGRVPVLTIPPNGAHGLVFALVDVTSPEWTKYSMTFSTPTESNGIRLRCYESTTTLNGTMYFDDFSITTVTLPVGLPGAPTAVTVSPGESSLVVNWQAPVGSVVDSYRVFVSTQINFGSHVPGWSNKDVGNMTTAQVNGLEESRTYYVRVRAYNRMRGTSAYSVMSSGITLDTTPPISPVLSGTPNEHTMTLSWTESVDVGSGVAGYEVDVSTDAGFGSYLSGWEKKDVGVATTTVVSGLISNSTYFARARAYDTSGNISISGPTLSVKTLPKDPRLTITITAPAPNTILTMKQTVSIQAEAGSATEATKIWFTLDGVTVSTAITAPYSYEWFITGANNGAHTWQATVFDAMGNSSTTVPVPVTVNIDILPPSTPILQSPTELSTTSVRFSWSVATDNVGVTGYRLYRDTSLIATIGGEETSFLDSGLAPETLYKYTVAAFDDMGNTSAMSPELSVTTPRRALLAPRGSLSGVSPQSVGIRWASVEGANRYTLAASLSVTSGHEFSLQREIPASETSDNESISGLSPNTTYYLYLNACNEFDCTDFVPLGSAVTHALPPALTAAEGRGKEVRLTINANGNPAGTKYRIEMSRGGGEFTLATTATSLSPVMGDLTPGERYIFRVKAENHAGVATEPSNTLSATIAPETVEGARAYPVPFRPGIGAEGITFDRIPEGSSVKIYTADGRPVKSLITNTEGSVLWDLTNDDGSPVSSGVFLALMEKNGGRKRFKVVVQK
jgi:hypothetical protein